MEALLFLKGFGHMKDIINASIVIHFHYVPEKFCCSIRC